MGVDVDGKKSDARGEQGEQECWAVEAGTGGGENGKDGMTKSG
jgi:hypothetical protein